MNEQKSSTRKVVLTLLKTEGSLSVSDLSRQLGITEMAVRRHVNTLERDGLIEAKLVRQPLGRPAQLYSLTRSADDHFPKRYHRLALELLSELMEEEGEERVGRLFERRKETMYSKYSGQIEGRDLVEKVAELAAIQNTNGYMTEWSQEKAGEFRLTEHNCPISRVANKYQQACACELALFQRLLGAEVERTECLAEGGAKCVYLIRSVASIG